MLTIVILKPIQLTMVREVPLDSSGAFWAIKVENKGESAITVIPQINKKARSKTTEFENKNKGEAKQHMPDKSNDMIAIFLAP